LLLTVFFGEADKAMFKGIKEITRKIRLTIIKARLYMLHSCLVFFVRKIAQSTAFNKDWKGFTVCFKIYKLLYLFLAKIF